MSYLKNILVIFILLGALGATLFLIYRTTSLNSRASSPSAANFTQNSYLFASPLTAKADGKEIIRLTAFLLDSRGLGIPNLLISLEKPGPLVTINSSDATDDTGKATFDLASPAPGTYTLKAKINDTTLPQTVKITFY